MTTPTLEQLFVGETREEVLASMLATGVQLEFPVTAWLSQDTSRELLTIFAQKLSDFSNLGSIAAGGGLLDYAAGDWLTLLAFELYAVERIDASFGTATETLTNTSNLEYTFAAGDLRFYNASSGATYTNTTPGTLQALSTTTTVLQADEAGTGSNASVGEITGFVTPLLGVSGTNAEPLTATDRELDAALRTRCRESLAKASPNGPEDAYDYFAKSATKADGSNAGITRTLVVQGNGSLFVYLADASGHVDDTTVDIVDAVIQANCVPTGITATVLSATNVDVLVQATVYLAASSTLTALQAQDAVNTQLTTYFSSIPIGGFDIDGSGGQVFLDAIIGQIFQAAPGQIVQAVVTLPLADVALQENEVAALTSQASDFTILMAP